MSHSKPIVSVIVPVYNVEKYLDKCVMSLINQTLDNIEIILVDDESTDRSAEMCDSYAQQYENIEVIHKKNGGLGSARNAGLQLARADYVGFVDSDDYIADDMYMTLYDLAIKNSADCAYCTLTRFWNENVEVVDGYSNNVVVYSDESIIDTYLLDRIGLGPGEKEDCSYGASVCVGLFKKSVILDNGLMFVSERELISEDMIFDIEFIPYCKKIVHIDRPMYFYRFNSDSLTTRYVGDRFEKNVVLWKEMRKRLNLIYSENRSKYSLSRYFLTFTRVSLIEEIVHLRQNGWKKVRRNIRRIANNEELVNILKSYPIKMMPITQRVFFFSLKNKWCCAVATLIKINTIRKKNSRRK